MVVIFGNYRFMYIGAIVVVGLCYAPLRIQRVRDLIRGIVSTKHCRKRRKNEFS